VEEIGVGALATSTDAPAQLVQLSETEAFRAVHYQRIDRGQVDARLDDRRAHEHVEATLPEVDHHPFERALVHLSVRDGDARVGHELSESSRHLIDVRDPVVDEEDLTFAQELSSHRLDHRRLVVLAHVREDGPAVGGGVVIIERSRMPTKAISRVRGIGLALRVKTSTPIERALIASCASRRSVAPRPRRGVRGP